VKDGKRFRRACIDMIIRKNKSLPFAPLCENIATGGAPRQFRNGDKASYCGKTLYEITSGE
jgi:hypothetical protein